MLRKILTSTLLSLVLVGGFFLDFDANTSGGVSIGVETYAATGSTIDADTQKMINKGIVYINGALEVLTVIVSPAIFLASWLMTPDWTSGDIFNLRPVLHDLWILVSNVTYFIYALLLIFIALATIFNSQNYGYKKLLPRLALGIILVPLTWWFVQFIISLSTIVTASVINLPMDVVQNNAVANKKTDAWWGDATIQQKFQFFTDDFDKAVFGGVAQEKKCDSTRCLTPKQVLTDASGVYSALLIYGHGVFKIGEPKNLKSGIDVAKTGLSILNQLLVSSIMFVIFGFLVIALVFLLFMRAIKLWFYAIFSPLMTLRYVIGDGLFGKDNADGFEIKEFIGLAFVPALVGLALSFGLMIITVLQNAGSKPGTTTACDGPTIISAQGCVIGSLAGNSKNTITSKLVGTSGYGATCDGKSDCMSLTILKFGGVEFEFYGGLVGKDAAVSNVNDTRGTLNSLGGMFGILIIDMISIIFIWTAFMAAKNVSKVAQAVIKPFEDMGGRIGKLGKELPKYTPLPIPGIGKVSLRGMDKVMDNAQYALNKKSDEDFKRSDLGKMFGGDRVTAKADEIRVKELAKSVDQTNHENLKMIGGLIRKNGNTDIEYSDMFKDVIGQLQQKFGNSPPKFKEALKNMGYDDKNAELIVYKTKDEGKINANDKDLITALKSMGTTGSKGDNNTSAGYTAGISNDDKGINLNIKNGDSTVNANIKLENLNDPEKISSAIKGNAVIQESMKGVLSSEEWDSLLKNRITDPEKRKKVIDGLGDIVKSKPNITAASTTPEPEVR